MARPAHFSCPAQRGRAGDLALHADSWGRALASGQASLSIPCFTERCYGGVLDEKLLMALSSDDLSKDSACRHALAADSLRYPIPQYNIQADARAGLGASFPACTTE